MRLRSTINRTLSLATLLTCSATAALLPTHAQAEDIAVVIGINEYEHLTNANLDGCVPDAQSFGDALKHKGFRVILLTDKQATKQAILDKIKEVSPHIGKDDRFVFYFAGHGTHDANDRCFLLTADAEESNYNHTLDKDSLARAINDIPTLKRTVLIDACHAEGALRGKGLFPFRSRYHQLQIAQGKAKSLPHVNQTDNNDEIVDPGFCGYAACKRNQPAAELDFGNTTHGIFTYYLTEELNKAIDNTVWDDIVTRVNAQVAKKMEGQQTPMFGPDDYRTRIVFDRRDGKKVDPKPAPHSLWDDYVDNKSDENYVRAMVDPDRSSFRIGEKFKVHIRAEHAGYLIVLNKDSSNKIFLFSPDPKITDIDALVNASRIKAKVTRTIDTQAVDHGTERVKAILFHFEADARALLSRFPKDGATEDQLLGLQRPRHLPPHGVHDDDDDGGWTYFTSEAEVDLLSPSEKIDDDGNLGAMTPSLPDPALPSLSVLSVGNFRQYAALRRTNCLLTGGEFHV